MSKKTGHIRAACPKKKARQTTTRLRNIATRGTALLGNKAGCEAGEVPIAVGRWLIDSGASHHMIGDGAALTELGPCAPVDTTLVDGSARSAVKAGIAEVNATVCWKQTTLTLSDVLVVPGLTVSLVSVRKMLDHGYSVTFTTHKVILGKSGKEVLKGEAEGAVFVVVAGPAGEARGGSVIGASAAIWHRRMGHVAPETLAKTAQAVTGLKVPAADLRSTRGVQCGPCMKGKMTRLPFPPSTSRTSKPLDLLHTDVCGPMSVTAAGGERFQIVFVDDHSRFKAVLSVKMKGEAKQVVRNLAFQ